jgi:hypothetical protein
MIKQEIIGFAERPWKEDNDCAVRSLAVAGDIGYAVAHILCEQAGRVEGKGVSPRAALEEYEKEGFGSWLNWSNAIDPTMPHARSARNQMTVNQFLTRNQKGRFILIVRAGTGYHGIAAVDGVIYDDSQNSGRSRSRVFSSIKVIPNPCVTSEAQHDDATR